MVFHEAWRASEMFLCWHQVPSVLWLRYSDSVHLDAWSVTINTSLYTILKWERFLLNGFQFPTTFIYIIMIFSLLFVVRSPRKFCFLYLIFPIHDASCFLRQELYYLKGKVSIIYNFQLVIVSILGWHWTNDFLVVAELKYNEKSGFLLGFFFFLNWI